MNSTFMEKERGNANRLSQISFIPTCLIVYNIITYGRFITIPQINLKIPQR